MMGQSTVTKERLEAAIRMLSEEAGRGEISKEPEAPAQIESKEILELVISPETLLKLVDSKTKQLVITINERK
jgi:hypothetical protein